MPHKEIGIIVAGIIPPALFNEIQKGLAIPRALVLDRVTKDGLTAGPPVEIGIRDLRPEEAVSVVQRFLEDGSLQPVVGFRVIPVLDGKPKLFTPTSLKA